MYKNLFVLLFIYFLSGTFHAAFSQSYYTESKSCGSCHKPVSSSSTIGMRCPHCGVRWGYENTKTSTTTKYIDNDYEKTSGFTASNVNLRSSPSTKSRVKALIPSGTFVTIISRKGDWYYIKYSASNGYYSEEIYGYVFKKLIY